MSRSINRADWTSSTDWTLKTDWALQEIVIEKAMEWWCMKKGLFNQWKGKIKISKTGRTYENILTILE